MRIIKTAAVKIKVDKMDAYHKNRGANGCNQGLDVYSGFHFHFKKDLQIIKGKYSNHIVNESHACDVCWWDWRQAKDVTNFVDDSINVNTLITDDWETLEKSNSDTS